MTINDQLDALDFEPSCDTEGCDQPAYRMWRPPFHCTVELACLTHTRKERLELELMAAARARCTRCGHVYAPELLEQRLPRVGQ